MYIFGGFEEPHHRFCQETYAFHFPNRHWKRLNSEGEPPQYRDFHAACVLDDKMYVFGGRSDEMGQSHSSQDVYLDDLKYLDLLTNRWHTVDAKGDKPCGRRSLTMWTFRGCLYMFGGYQSLLDIHYNDLYKWDPTTSEWAKLNPNGISPAPRRRQCTVVVGNRVFLFGGTMPNLSRQNMLADLGDLHILDFEPTLTTLCAKTIVQNGLVDRCAQLLPTTLRNELYYMNTPNIYSKSSNDCRLIGRNG